MLLLQFWCLATKGNQNQGDYDDDQHNQHGFGKHAHSSASVNSAHQIHIAREIAPMIITATNAIILRMCITAPASRSQRNYGSAGSLRPKRRLVRRPVGDNPDNHYYRHNHRAHSRANRPGNEIAPNSANTPQRN
jgi:hypothetical protein